MTIKGCSPGISQNDKYRFQAGTELAKLRDSALGWFADLTYLHIHREDRNSERKCYHTKAWTQQIQMFEFYSLRLLYGTIRAMDKWVEVETICV
jgi:hypothetical protein